MLTSGLFNQLLLLLLQVLMLKSFHSGLSTHMRLFGRVFPPWSCLCANTHDQLG